MRKLWTRRGMVFPTVVTSVAVLVQFAGAAPFPKFARKYIVWMGRAVDDCNPTTLTVLSPPGLPSGGCLQANTVTDDGMTMKSARLAIDENGKIILLGMGLVPAAAVKIELVLRVTRANVNTSMGPQTVTFPDVTVQCPPVFPQVDGSVYGVTSLADCLGSNSGLATGNVEIVDASLLNGDNGDSVFAKPGILR